MNEATLRMVLHLTARMTFVVFVGAYIGNALRDLWPGVFSAWLSRSRDWFIVGIGASHTLHLAAIVAYYQVVGWSQIRFLRVLPGGLTYMVIYALAVAAILRLSGRKEPFYRTGSGGESFALNLIWFVFASAFVPRIVRGWPAYTFFGVLALVALAIRIAGRARRPQPAAASGQAAR
jgi:methionine sulfoxide reductase heme-binding subunit